MGVICMQPVGAVTGEVRLPGSKSLANRALICAAASAGETVLRNPPSAADSRVMASALAACGVPVSFGAGEWRVAGLGGGVSVVNGAFDVGEAGTVARFLPPFLCAGDGEFTLDGGGRMRERPMRDLAHALIELGASVAPANPAGGLPWRVRASGLQGVALRLRAGVSSQFVSGLLMAAPLLRSGELELVVVGEARSWPYVEMTRAVMADFGVAVVEEQAGRLRVPAGQSYDSPGDWSVEVDASGAAFFLAAAAITGGEVSIPGLREQSAQGDARMAGLLERMGARVRWDSRGVTVSGRAEEALDADLGDAPDLVPPLAAVAAQLEGESHFRRVGHLRAKESDRLETLGAELSKVGARVTAAADTLSVCGPPRCGARLEPRGDHRMAMAFALIGLVQSGVEVGDCGCVAKSMPEYFDRLEALAPGCVAERIDA